MSERKKFEPTVLRYAGMADLPTIDEIVRLAEAHDWVIFEVPTCETIDADGKRHDPTTAERDAIAQQLTLYLPAHKVNGGWNILDEAFLFPARKKPFEAGEIVEAWGRFSTRRNMTKKAIDENVDLFLMAAAKYEEVTNPLMTRLAWQLCVDVATFSFDESWHKHHQWGRLRRSRRESSAQWRYFFHGVDCMFTNTKSGVCVEARLGFGAECGDNFGILDPGFFLEFLKHTTGFTLLADVLRDDWSDTRRALEYLEHLRLMRRVKSAHDISCGHTLSDLGRQRIKDIQAAANEKPDV